MRSDELKPLIVALTELGGQHVWSMLVSVFGDLAQEPGTWIAGPTLSAVMGAMLVRPEATRVALHRLRNDAWILSEKSGRISNHSLTEHGRRESARASKRIYARPEDVPTDWQIALVAETTPDRLKAMQESGFVPLLPHAFVGPSPGPFSEDTLHLTAQTIPAWVRQQLSPDPLRLKYANLAMILQKITEVVSRTGALSPCDRAVLRCLIVHNWRRLVLKHPALPPSLHSEDWKEQECRCLVTELLDRIGRPALAEITSG